MLKKEKSKVDLPAYPERRRFLAMLTTALAGLGAFFAMRPFIVSWMPSAQTKAKAAPISVNIADMKPGEKKMVQWQGKPVWIIRRTDKMLESLNTDTQLLRDPDSLVDQQPAFAHNQWRSLQPEFLVVIGVCTHLGCIPLYKPEAELPGFYCPCHASIFDMAGRVLKNMPAPINLAIPPYYFKNAQEIIIGKDAP